MSTGCKAVAQLAPEQQKALREFQNRLPEWETLREPVPDSIIPSGFFSFAYQPFPKLAHGASWIWNQTNGKVNVQTEEGQSILLQKMNARKRKNCPKAPSYKVWLYTMDAADGNNPLYAIWCEKGLEATEDGSDPAEAGEKAEKKVVSCSLNINTPVRVPTIQQVKEFNHMDSILKKRDRAEVFHPGPAASDERTLPALPARKQARVIPQTDIPSARNFAPGGRHSIPAHTPMGAASMNFQPVNNVSPHLSAPRGSVVPGGPPSVGESSIQRIFSSYNPPQVHGASAASGMGSPMQRAYLPSMSAIPASAHPTPGLSRNVTPPQQRKSNSTEDVGDTLHSLSIHPSHRENQPGMWIQPPEHSYGDVKQENVATSSLPKSLLSRFEDPSRLPLPVAASPHHDLPRQPYDYSHYQYHRYPGSVLGTPRSPSDEPVPE